MSKTYAEMQIGDTAEFTKVITMDDVQKFADATGDKNEIHINPEAGAKSRFGQCVAHGALVVGMFGTALGLGYAGSGTIYLSQTVKFKAPVFIGDEITVRIEVLEKLSANRVKFRSYAVKKDGTVVSDGESMVMVPN